MTNSWSAVRSCKHDVTKRTKTVESSSGTASLSYDYEDRVSSISYPGGGGDSFTYNGLDTRVGKVDSAGTAAYKRDAADVTDPVLSDGSALFTSGVSERRGSATLFDHKDYLGTVSRQTNSSQATTGTRAYDAFGMLVSSTGTPQGPFGFAGGYGYQEDADSGLKLLGHRYYDPSTGRFLTRDPAKDGRNWYGYCDNEPTVGVDPQGRFALVLGLAFLAAVGLYLALTHLAHEGEKARNRYKKHLADAADPDGPTVAPDGGPPSWAQESPPEFQKFNKKVGSFIVDQMNDQYVNTTISKGIDTVHEGAGDFYDLGVGLGGLTKEELEQLKEKLGSDE